VEVSDVASELEDLPAFDPRTVLIDVEEWPAGYCLVRDDLRNEAVAEIKQLRAAIRKFVAACETAPPTSLMIEIGIACKTAKAALSAAKGET
jgi:hypothetical protein